MPSVDVADLHPVRRVGAEQWRPRSTGPFREVLPELVADHRGPGPQHGHREGAGTDPRLQDPLARADVGRDEDGAEVLG